jgi:hypothetical protein
MTFYFKNGNNGDYGVMAFFSINYQKLFNVWNFHFPENRLSKYTFKKAEFLVNPSLPH